jgi:hypothetical protein
MDAMTAILQVPDVINSNTQLFQSELPFHHSADDLGRILELGLPPYNPAIFAIRNGS